jgi:uncharacterized protein involved in response to NO
LLSYGFRPFFLFGALYAGLAVALWLPIWSGAFAIPTAFSPRDWHVHELLYGFVPAVVTGFLLTAIPNWTGRLPLSGMPLAALFAMWVLGRLAVSTSELIGWWPATAIDAAFLMLVAAAAAREIVAGRNWRNLKVVAIVSLLALGNIAFHLESRLFGAADYTIRLGIGAVVLLIVLIGGRIIPSFTRNWLVRQNPGHLPAPFGRFDKATVVASAGALGLFVAQPSGTVTGIVLIVTGVFQTVRLARWAGYRTLSDRLVLILHVGYAFVPVGFMLSGAAALGLIASSAGLHAWTAGAIGTMTLAVMTRASLGHTGHALHASLATQLIYAAVVAGAFARIAAALVPEWGILLSLSAALWSLAFFGFVVTYGPTFCGARFAARVAEPAIQRT